MTLEELNQLQAIEKLIEREKNELLSMREKLGLHGSNITGMPKAGGARDKIGDVMPGIVDKERELLDIIAILEGKRQRIMDWIDALPNARLQLIAKLRFADGKSWEEVADKLDDGRGADACKKCLYRYLSENKKKKRSDDWW